MNRTREQELAVTTRDTNLLVSAAAGAGKTKVLVDRIMSMVVDGHISISKMLIVTFTRDAAKVMRSRLQSALEDAACNAQGEDAVFLAQQLDELAHANISTLHTFCQKFLRKNFAAAGIPANFRLADEQKMQLLRDRAVGNVLEEAYEQATEDFINLTRLYCRTTGDEALIDLLFAVYEFSRCQSDPTACLLHALKLFETWDVERDHIWNDLANREIFVNFDAVLQTLDKARNFAALYPETEDLLDLLLRDTELVLRKKQLLQNDLDAFFEDAGAFARMPSKRKLSDSEKRNRDYVKDLRDAAKKAFKKAADAAEDVFSAEARDAMPKVYRAVREIVRLVQLLSAQMHEQMVSQGMLDFSALEHYTIAALRAGAAADFQAIFFDEYQDANAVQECIVQLLAKPDTLFFVGDVKQSIYRFRSADPGLFLEKHALWGAGDGGMRIDLNRNFRSRQSVLDAVNSVFFRVMQKNEYSIAYDAAEALYPGVDSQLGGPKAQLHVIDAAQADEDDALAALRADEIEARYVAGLVADLLQTGTITERETGQERSIQKDDIAILLRATSSTAESMAYALEREGIDCIAQMSSRHFDTVEVRAIIDLLSVLDNPHQDVPLLGALRSPLFLFELDDLARVRIKAPRGSFIDALKACADEDDALGRQCRDALEKIEHWRLLSRVLTLHELIEQIMSDTDYEDLLLASPIGLQKLANIRLLLSRVDAFCEGTFDGLPQFLQFVKRVRQGKDSEEAVQSHDAGGAVRIMSIHKSKGLEFPVVILPMMGRKFYFDQGASIFMDKDAGIAVKTVDAHSKKTSDNIACFAVRSCAKAQDVQEEMRVLYVGMTRACEQLIMTGMKKGGIDAYEAELIAQPNCLLDWVAPSALMENAACASEGAEPVWQIIRAQLPTDEEIQEEAVEETAEVTQLDAALYAKIDEIFSWQYPETKETLALSKTTVTALKLYGDLEDREPGEAELPLPKRPSSYGTSIGKRKGTATHLAVQHMDIAHAQTKADVTAQIDRLAKEGFLTEDDRKLINDRDVLQFCTGALGLRMAKAQQAGCLYRETDFTFVPDDYAEGTLVQGAIDAWFEEEEGIVLVDFKTDALPADGVEGLVRHYARQLRWYRDALARLTGKQVHQVLLYSFAAGKWAPYTEE